MVKVVLVALYFITSSSYAFEVKAVSDIWPPYIINMEKGEGYLVEVLIEATKRGSLRLKGETKSFNKSKDLVYDGKADILVGCTDDFNVGARIIKVPLAKLQYGFFEKVTHLKKWNYKGISSLKSKRLGVIKGYGHGPLDGYVSSSKNVKQFQTKTPVYDLLKAVEEDQIDILLQDVNVTAYTLNKRFNNLKLRSGGLLKGANNIYLCISENSENSMSISDVIEGSLEEMLKDGTISKLKQKYSIQL